MVYKIWPNALGAFMLLAASPIYADAAGMVSVSFDDNWKSQYEEALPILSDAGIDATFYITTDTLEPGKYRGFMSADQVRELNEKGHEIGSHTVHHTDLTKVDEDEALDELEDSKAALEALLDEPVEAFAYPYGAYSPEVVELVEQVGYEHARTTQGGTNTASDEPLLLTAISPDIDTSLDEIKTAIDYAYDTDTWLIITFHEINDSGKQYSHTPEFLQEVIDYIQEKEIETVTVGEGLGKLHGISSTPDTPAAQEAPAHSEEGLELELQLNPGEVLNESDDDSDEQTEQSVVELEADTVLAEDASDDGSDANDTYEPKKEKQEKQEKKVKNKEKKNHRNPTLRNGVSSVIQTGRSVLGW